MGRKNRKVSEGSRVEAGTHRSESREISIPSAVGISGLRAGEDVNDTTAAGMTTLVDGQRILQVMTNLLSNAVKFSPSESTVSVALSEPAPQRIRVEVHDHGPGISPQFRDKIFTLFAQGDASDSRPKGGTGLGLAISKALVEHMGGAIGFTPNAGGGTTFFFELPAQSAASLPARAEAAG